MRKGFTLLELVVVIIILGVLATLGIQQYMFMVERSRGAEARTILGQIRTTAAAYRMEKGTLTGFNNAYAGIGGNPEDIPNACAATHYFSYTVIFGFGDLLLTNATRCVAGGKAPNRPNAANLLLVTNLTTGQDTWAGTGIY